MNQTDTLIIREATAADLPGLLALYAQLGEDDGEVLQLEEAERLLTRMATYPDYHLYLGLCAGNPVATMALLIMDNLGHKGTPSAIVEDVVVDVSHRGKGLGKQMLTFAAEMSRAKGCYKIMLSSNHNRVEAHAFYRSLGYSMHGYSFFLTVNKQHAAGLASPALTKGVQHA